MGDVASLPAAEHAPPAVGKLAPTARLRLRRRRAAERVAAAGSGAESEAAGPLVVGGGGVLLLVLFPEEPHGGDGGEVELHALQGKRRRASLLPRRADPLGGCWFSEFAGDFPYFLELLRRRHFCCCRKQPTVGFAPQACSLVVKAISELRVSRTLVAYQVSWGELPLEVCSIVCCPCRRQKLSLQSGQL